MAVYKDEKELMSTDWQGKINEAVAAGDYSAAAQYEQARNDKINSGSYTGKQTTTNNYSSYLNTGSSGGSSGSSASNKYAGTDYHQDAIDAAMNDDWEGVYAALANRAEKISAQGGDDRGKSNEQILADLIAQYGKKQQQVIPEYSSQFSSQIDSLLNSILNREEFSYDYSTDPTYLAYAQQYKRLGDRAREDTLGDVASLTGGYASSWATSAASQAQNDYNSQLSGVIPELYDAAYNRYLGDYNMDTTNLGLLMDLDNTYYNRYRDTVSDSQWQQQFDTSNNQWQQTFDWNKTVDQWNMDNTEATQKFDQLMSKWQLTGVADSEVAAELGVPVGATTESYYFNKLASQLDQAKLSMQQQEISKADKAEAEANAEKASIISRIAQEAKIAVDSSSDSVYGGANYILDTMADYKNVFGASLSYSDYIAIGKQAGIPDYILEDAFYDRADEIAKEGVGNTTTTRDKTYWKNAAFSTSDPAAFLASNMIQIMADGIDYAALLEEMDIVN